MTNPKLKQIIEDLTRKFPQGGDGWRDYYDMIIGIHGKKCRPLSQRAFYAHGKAMRKQGTFVWVPLDGRPDFFSYGCEMPGEYIRFYMNAGNAKKARKIVKLTAEGIKEGTKFQIKTVGLSPSGYTRFDNTVLYVLMDDVRPAAELVQRISEENEDLFDDEVLFTVKKIEKGAGYAVNPPRGERCILGETLDRRNFTFNHLHSYVLKRTFEEIGKRGTKDLDEMAELYSQALKDAKLNPEKPYLNLGEEDPYEKLGVRK